MNSVIFRCQTRVLFEIVNAPRGVRLRVNALKSLQTNSPQTCCIASVCIQAKLEPIRMRVVRQRFDARWNRLRVNNHCSIRISTIGTSRYSPSIVHIDVFIAKRFEIQFDISVDCLVSRTNCSLIADLIEFHVLLPMAGSGKNTVLVPLTTNANQAKSTANKSSFGRRQQLFNVHSRT